MNQKEISELRRRFRAGKSNISHIYGCYVNTKGEIVTMLDAALGQLPEQEAELYLSRLKKVLSGTQGKNLFDIVFSTQQVADSEAHTLLMSLRDSMLENGDIRYEFYRKAIDALDMEGSNYIILMAAESYDVPYRSKDGEEQADASDSVFKYYVCAVCPTKDENPELRYFSGDNEFHTDAATQVVGATALGFVFPAFDDRAANIYNALYYARKPEELHQEFIDAVFKTDSLMTASKQKNAFHAALSEALGDECRYDVLQSVNGQMLERVEEHKSEKNPEALSLSFHEVEAMLRRSGVSDEKVAAFNSSMQAQFGGDVALQPANLAAGSLEIETPTAKITIPAEYGYALETRVIDGRKYILIPADEAVTVNGVEFKIPSN